MLRLVCLMLLIVGVTAVSGCASGTPRPVLLVFTAEWCAPCQRMKPHLAEIDKSGAAHVVEIDADANPNVMQQYGVTKLPTIICLSPEGQELWRANTMQELRARWQGVP